MSSDFDVWRGAFLRLAEAETWRFKAQGQAVDPVEVFASTGFAPAILAVAQRELEIRGFPVDLGLYFDTAPVGGPLGVSVAFGDAKTESGKENNPLGRQYWRLASTSFVLDALRASDEHSVNNVIVLDPLFAVFQVQDTPAPAES